MAPLDMQEPLAWQQLPQEIVQQRHQLGHNLTLLILCNFPWLQDKGANQAIVKALEVIPVAQ